MIFSIKTTTTLAALLAASSCALAGDLSVEIHGITSNEGRVFIALFNSPASYKANQALLGQQVDAVKRGDSETITVTFPNLAPGQYALQSFYDLNGDGKLGRNLFGVPTEPYGFSNRAVASFGPPSFEAASIAITDAPTTTHIDLK
jgi:uncharacterized protein (DUF2141 family)